MTSFFTPEQLSPTTPPRGLSQQQTQIVNDSTAEERLKRRDRYFVLAGPWHYQTNPKEFLGWGIDGNVITRAQYYLCEKMVDYKDNVLYETYRYPGEIITDLAKNNKHFVELPALAEFDSTTVDRIVQVLNMQTRCDKYPSQNQFVCTYCWSRYLDHDIAARIETELQTPEQKDAAYSSARIISEQLAKATETLMFQEDQALRDLEDMKSGKSKLDAFDIMVIRHQHHDLPRLKTSTDRESEMPNLLRELVSALKPQQLPLDTATLKAQLAELQKQIEEAEQAEFSTLSPTQQEAKTIADTMEKVRAAKKNKESVE